MLDSGDDFAFWSTAAAGCEQRLDTTFFANRAAQIAHRGYAILLGYGTFAQAPRDVFQSLNYRAALLQTSFEEFLQFMHSALSGKEKPQADNSRALCSPIINAGDERQDRSSREVGRALHTSTRELVREYLKSG